LLKDTWDRFKAGQKPMSSGPDGFPIYAENPNHAEHELLSAFIRKFIKRPGLGFISFDPCKTDEARNILASPPAARARFILAVMERFPWFWKANIKESTSFLGIEIKGWSYREPDWHEEIPELLEQMYRATIPFTEDQMVSIIHEMCANPRNDLLYVFPTPVLIRHVSAQWSSATLPQGLKDALQRYRAHITKTSFGSRAEERKLLAALDILLGLARPELLDPGEAWSDLARSELNQMQDAEASCWISLLTHCKQAGGSKPTKKWLKVSDELVALIGRDPFKSRVIRWFELVARTRTVHDEVRHAHSPDPDQLLSDDNATVLRGLVWCCSGWGDAHVSSALATLAEVCFKKVRWHGARCPRVGNACLLALSGTSTEDAAAQLSRLDSTVKQPTAKKRIGKSLDAAATLTGQSREDLEEKSVPTFGLGPDDTLACNFGDCSATLRVVDSRDVEISWFKNGKAVKSVPSDVKQNHTDELKQFQKLGKDIAKMLTAQRIRIERLLMSGREWSFDLWRQRYLDHQLLAGISRRLIWHFKLGERSALGAWRDGMLVDVHNLPLDWLAPETCVRLWHPIGFPVETVAAWREWIHAQEICQPFKQAHREVYILADAELRTGNYSNRFAAHILGQHQFAALCTQRGWKYSLMGGFDSYSVPTLELPAWDMLAEFWVEGVGEVADSGIALHLSTDQIRFVRAGEPLSLTEVPATVFSEVMRDVDLFVGVGSIGSNPAWQDQGEIEGAGNYWQTYSFGELNASAKTRREVLVRLIPKLKIAGQCSFEEKFLVVKGSIRTYKIHLGSGNIQMEPNNQYLCIVPDQSTAARKDDKVLLPFEGDRTLSVILSKAFLLADDSKIKDSSIVSQIKVR